MKLLEGKVALVTGGARGIGRAICEAYADQGAHVVIGDINGQGAQMVSSSINQKGMQESAPFAFDVSDPVQVEEALLFTRNKFGKLDILVNNAAVLKAHLIVDFPLQDWQDVFRINMQGTFLCSQAACKRMIEQGHGGVILHVSSCSARKADSKHAAYSASKAAIITFSRILALEVGKYNIRSNCILPGATLTEMLMGVFDSVPGIREDLISKTVLGKLGDPKDQANAAVFLASDLASHITGEYLIVSGGEFMNA
jgi:NAD(P)-dependent dehydrogenase (short-subunit alcohol dehydrogenase family)